MDWLLPLRSGENEECRYAIRSWIQNAGLGADDQLVTVGDLPSWLEPDEHLPGNVARSGPVNVYTNVRDACMSGQLGDQAIIANDDMFAMEPTDPTVIAYRSSLTEHIARLPQRTSWWASSLRITAMMLRRRGIAQPLSYELHRPLLVGVGAMGWILTDCWAGVGIPPQFRSLYGNLHEIGGEQAADGKVVTRSNWPHSGPWLSSTDGSWRWLAAEIAEKFPEPSRYERTP